MASMTIVLTADASGNLSATSAELPNAVYSTGGPSGLVELMNVLRGLVAETLHVG